MQRSIARTGRVVGVLVLLWGSATGDVFAQTDLGITLGVVTSPSSYGRIGMAEARYNGGGVVGLLGSRAFAPLGRFALRASLVFQPSGGMRIQNVGESQASIRHKGRRIFATGGVAARIIRRVTVDVGLAYSRFQLTGGLNSACGSPPDDVCAAEQRFAGGTRGFGASVGLEPVLWSGPFSINGIVRDIVSAPNEVGAPALTHDLFLGLAVMW